MFSCPFQHEEYVILESDIQSIVTHLLTAHDIRIENIEEVTLVLDKYIESCKDRSFSAHGPHFLGGDLDLRKKLHAEKLVYYLLTVND